MPDEYRMTHQLRAWESGNPSKPGRSYPFQDEARAREAYNEAVKMWPKSWTLQLRDETQGGKVLELRPGVTDDES